MYYINDDTTLENNVIFVNSTAIMYKVKISDKVKIINSYINGKTVLEGNLEVKNSYIDMFTIKKLSGDGVISDDAYICFYEEFEECFKSKQAQQPTIRQATTSLSPRAIIKKDVIILSTMKKQKTKPQSS